MLASDEWAEREGKEVLATIVAQAAVADDFAYLARTPANAAIKALDKAGLQPGDIDLWEINEAFASVTLNSIRMLGIDEDRVNVNGGAVAIGHPIGASGARILATLVHELRRRGGGYGCAAICSGGGQGDAVIVQVVTERPHILPPPPGGGALRRPDEPGAAFFDLDRTLMAGSSAFQFGRAAYKAGLVNRRALAARRVGEPAASGCAARPTRAPTRCAQRIGELLEGVRVRDLQRLAPDVLAGVLPRAVPADARDRLRAPGRRAPDLHLHRRLAGDGAS